MLHDETLHDITLQTECYLDKIHDRMLLRQNVTRQNVTWTKCYTTEWYKWLR